METWFNANVYPDWMECRNRLMRLLQEEAELQEIVQLVGMDALSAPERLKLEAARSIREDFLHQNSFHEIDTYTSLEKQYRMMKLVLAYYDEASAAMAKGADIEALVDMTVREEIGRYKYTPEKDIQPAYEKVRAALAEELEELIKKEDE